MPRFAVIAGALLLASCAPAAQEDLAPAEASSTQTPGGYREAAAALDAAIVARNSDSLRSLVADDFLWVRGSGASGNKVAFVNALTSADMVIEPFRPIDVRWLLQGNSALLTGTNTLKGRAKGEPFVDRHRFADYWVWRGGRWQLLYIQVTPDTVSMVDPD